MSLPRRAVQASCVCCDTSKIRLPAAVRHVCQAELDLPPVSDEWHVGVLAYAIILPSKEETVHCMLLNGTTAQGQTHRFVQHGQCNIKVVVKGGCKLFSGLYPKHKESASISHALDRNGYSHGLMFPVLILLVIGLPRFLLVTLTCNVDEILEDLVLKSPVLGRIL